jgi:type II secretory pathway component PulF
VRYRTLAISCFVLLGAMFVVPATIGAVFLPSLKQGLPDPIPFYERILLEIAVFCGSWKWLLVLLLLGLGMAFTVAELASSRVSK